MHVLIPAPQSQPATIPHFTHLQKAKETTGFICFPHPPPTISFIFKRLFGSFAGPTPAAMSSAKAQAQNLIDQNAVMVFSKSYCPYCNSSKELLKQVGAQYKAIELDQIDDGDAIQAALQEISGQRTVPNIFIGQQHIGGNSDLQAKKSQLPQLLKAVGASS
ncbi:hypothetical protein N7478_013173 [Penicillium angulare]|uniref:uncharacterized protein n=1 Tax=Penicillium angulare TaxID=116970 RepID=UPI002540DC9F|nr:uncharacterized protein N7478_013173 [Penicillium angulare]KAJ5257069.1 hypothetical protein N7478_013173 [Penicillium angulare]